MASSAGSLPETATSTVPTVTPAATSAFTVPSGVLDRGDGAHRGAEGSGGDFREHLAVEGGVDGADIGLAQLLVPGVRPPGPVRRHDGDEIGVGVAHDLQRIGLQQGRGIGGVRGLQHQGVVGDGGGDGGHPAAGLVVGVVAGVHEGGRAHDCRQGQHEQQIGHKQPAGRCSSGGSSTPPMTNMNATVSQVTPCANDGYHKGRT